MSAAEILQNNQIRRFILVGGGCYLTNLIILLVGVEIAGWPYQAVMVFSIVVVNLMGWALHRSWVFESQTESIIKEIFKYSLTNMGGMAFSFFLMLILVEVLGFYYIPANLTVAFGMVAVNFVLHKNFSFSRRWSGNHRT